MKFVTVVLISAVLAPSISVAASAHAQPIGWEVVEKLPAGARLRLVFTDGSIATGKLVELGPDAITLADTSIVRGRQGSGVLRERRSFPLAGISSVEPQKRMSGAAKIITIGAIAGGVIVGYYLWLLANSQ